MFTSASFYFAAGYATGMSSVQFPVVFTNLLTNRSDTFQRESKWWVALLWAVFIMLLGNALTCVYVAIALIQCKGDSLQFWLGVRNKHQSE